MTSHTKESLAALLNGREYGKELSNAEAAEALAVGLVVVYGYSDDNMEFAGAIADEIGAWDGTTVRVTPLGVLPAWDAESMSNENDAEAYFLKKHAGFREITAIWAGEGDYSWTYNTDIPHATFEIVEDGLPFCRGIVFSLADIQSAG